MQKKAHLKTSAWVARSQAEVVCSVMSCTKVSGRRDWRFKDVASQQGATRLKMEENKTRITAGSHLSDLAITDDASKTRPALSDALKSLTQGRFM